MSKGLRDPEGSSAFIGFIKQVPGEKYYYMTKINYTLRVKVPGTIPIQALNSSLYNL